MSESIVQDTAGRICTNVYDEAYIYNHQDVYVCEYAYIYTLYYKFMIIHMKIVVI
jgi:hypothetical protein